jgi:hypothetical protein
LPRSPPAASHSRTDATDSSGTAAATRIASRPASASTASSVSAPGPHRKFSPPAGLVNRGHRVRPGVDVVPAGPFEIKPEIPERAVVPHPVPFGQVMPLMMPRGIDLTGE